ncbi:MAG: response regulator [Fulvivirga sp.]
MTQSILLVEDNEDDITLTMRALKKKNITSEVIVARDGVEALDLLFGRNGKEPIKPTLILLDLKLPKKNGLEVLQEIRQNENTNGLCVVVLTTSNQEEDIIKSYALGANSYLRKPVDFLQFTETVGQLGLYWLVLNEPNPVIHE